MVDGRTAAMVDGGAAAGGTNPVRAVLTVRVGAENAEAFARAWSEVAAWAGSQPGCLRQSLCREEGGDGSGEVVFTIASDWRDERAFRAFERSDEQEVATAELRRLRSSARMRLLAIVAHVPG